MDDTKDLLRRIAALRQRLQQDQPAGAKPPDSLAAAVADVARGNQESLALETVTRVHDPAAAVTATVILTARGARVLRKAREQLHALRALAEEPVLIQGGANDPLVALYAETAAMLDAVLRAVQVLPTAAGEQIRLSEGLEAVLRTVDERVGALEAGLEHRQREEGRIGQLAEILLRLAMEQPVGLGSFCDLAEALIREARAGEPVRFHSAPPHDPARFAAAHALTVAQVLTRLVLDDPHWQEDLTGLVVAALVHDVGMTRVPAEILGRPGPLDDEDRRAVEGHTLVARRLLASLWPGGGWPVEAATDHHERCDGTGYPNGRTDVQLSDVVKLLAVCDVYAALCTPRPHRPALDTRAALTETLLMAERGALDKVQAERLLLLSFYPPGSVVELSDGAVAVVVAAQAGPKALACPDRPVVTLLTDAHGQGLAVPRVVDLAAQRDRAIVRALHPDDRRRLLGAKYPELV